MAFFIAGGPFSSIAFITVPSWKRLKRIVIRFANRLLVAYLLASLLAAPVLANRSYDNPANW